MGGHIGPPLRKMSGMAVLLFAAVAALRFSPCYVEGGNGSPKRVETTVGGVYPFVFVAKPPLFRARKLEYALNFFQNAIPAVISR